MFDNQFAYFARYYQFKFFLQHNNAKFDILQEILQSHSFLMSQKLKIQDCQKYVRSQVTYEIYFHEERKTEEQNLGWAHLYYFKYTFFIKKHFISLVSEINLPLVSEINEKQ